MQPALCLERAVYARPVAELNVSSDLTGPYYDITTLALQRLRFLNIESFLTEHVLELDELNDTRLLPDLNYAAISHVWSNPAARCSAGVMIRGLPHQDPISIDVFSILCLAARMEGCSHIWLDKLCIIQDTDIARGCDDQEWQIPHVHGIYRNCKICLVAPGGLGRLSKLDEYTPYLERLWTLQESLAPRVVKCVFEWDRGDAVLQTNSLLFITAIGSSGYAAADLFQLVVFCVKGGGNMSKGASTITDEFQPVHIFGPRSGNHRRTGLEPAWALLGCKDHDPSFHEPEVAATALWRAMIVRTSKYPQDLIFGAMGMFGVEVPPIPGTKPRSSYSNAQLAQLLVAFIRKVSARGFRAQWLGCVPTMPPAVQMTALPPLPTPSESGEAQFHATSGGTIRATGLFRSSPMVFTWWIRDGISPQRIEDNGDMTFTALAHNIRPTLRQSDPESYEPQVDHRRELVCLQNQRIFELAKSSDTNRVAVIVGYRNWYLRGDFPVMITTDMTLLMLLAEEAGVWRNFGYAWGDENIAEDWTERAFTVGGASRDLRRVDVSFVQSDTAGDT